MDFNDTDSKLLMKNNIDELIKIGKYYSDSKVEDIKNNIENIKLDFDRRTQHKLHSYFRHSSHGYSKSDLSYIFIGIVVGEVYLMDGGDSGYGSVTSTTQVYNILKKEYPLRSKVMKKWSSCFGFRNTYFYRS